MRLHRSYFPVSQVITAVLFAVGLLSLTALSAAGQEDKSAKQNEQGTQHEHTNRLADETSPYLLMHAHNPVDWYPWGEEAIQKARDENKPIFLSVGYSSCHWCHVMERESFLDEEIAKYLNEHFVCIKVDREERPDVDSIYMTSLHIFNELTRSGRGGGWPLTMFMTPDGKPFFGGTYFPARDGDRTGATGFLTVAQRVNEAWNQQRDFVMRDAEKLAELTRTELAGRRDEEAGAIQQQWIKECLTALTEQYDPTHGGFGFSDTKPNRPKFPESSKLIFMLDVLENDPENKAVKTMLEVTLDQMFQGGIYDHVGGGFHRYSVDRYWHIPHFEKMLYDNGQLLSVYSRALEFLPKTEYRQACEEIVACLLREMTSEEGAFYSALDAESEGEEGKFYRWETEELQNILSADEFARYSDAYGISDEPNFEEKYYVPQLKVSLDALAKTRNQTAEETRKELAVSNSKLLEVRNQRPRPLLDTKILTSWNGLMIRGLADAGRILEKPEYIQAAIRAADFLWEYSWVEGRLKRTYTAGQARLNAYLDDYAFLIDGMIGLHQATGDKKWLERAVELQSKQDELFSDNAAGGYFFTSSDHEVLLARVKNPSDGAVPAGMSVSASNLLYLAEKTGKASYRESCKKMLQGSASLIDDFPTLTPRLLTSVRAFADE